MRHLTLIMAYYENRVMLQHHLHMFCTYPKKARSHLHVIVVDDGSPNSPARLDTEPEVHFELYRMQVDVRWNQDACRNLGAHHAKTEWILLTDMDHLLPPETLDYVLTQDLNPGYAYRFSRVSAPDNTPYKPHPNSWLMTKDMYWSIGGYDERLAGWYGTDGDFLDRVKAACPVIQIDHPLIRVPREVIPDSSTTTLTRKTPQDAEMIRSLRKQYAGTKPHVLTFPWEKVI